jgi:hypothetical protein
VIRNGAVARLGRLKKLKKVITPCTDKSPQKKLQVSLEKKKQEMVIKRKKRNHFTGKEVN